MTVPPLDHNGPGGGQVLAHAGAFEESAGESAAGAYAGKVT